MERLGCIGLGTFVRLWVCILCITSLRAAEFGLSVSHGEFMLRGAPFRGVGVNYFDAFTRTFKNPPRYTFESGLEELEKQKIPFVRFAGGGFWPADWGLYLTNRNDYFKRFDVLVQAAEQHHLGLIPSLFWQISTVPDLVKEPVNRWGRTNSATHAFMRDYVREVVSRYAASPAIWGWEFGNEYNLSADLPNASLHRPPVVPELGTPTERSSEDELTQENIETAFAAFASEVRKHDGHRAIFTGNAFPRMSEWHQRHEKNWQHDSLQQFAEVLMAENPTPINTITLRAYEAANDLSRLPQAMEVARTSGKPVFVGEFGVPGQTTKEVRERFQSILGALETNRVSLAALWVFDFNGQSRDWNVNGTNNRAWQLQAIQELNESLRSGIH